MKRAILGLVAMSLPLAAIAANGEREFQHESFGVGMEPAVRVELSRDRDFVGGRAEESERLAVPMRQVMTPRSLSDRHPVASASGAPSAVAAPEIDPASAASGLILLLGGIAVLRGRKGRAV